MIELENGLGKMKIIISDMSVGNMSSQMMHVTLLDSFQGHQGKESLWPIVKTQSYQHPALSHLMITTSCDHD